ncbi:MAG: hypothetical protein GXX94_04385 [Chloroflexi bacterium]|nr:hypothetical protein [Chloroflexota bacterium]
MCIVYRQVGKTDMKVSTVVYGSFAAGGHFDGRDDAAFLRAMEAMLDAG